MAFFAFYAIRNLLKKLKICGIVWQKSVTILVMGKSAKLFLVSLSQQITAGGPEALLYFTITFEKLRWNSNEKCKSILSIFVNILKCFIRVREA